MGYYEETTDAMPSTLERAMVAQKAANSPISQATESLDTSLDVLSKEIDVLASKLQKVLKPDYDERTVGVQDDVEPESPKSPHLSSLHSINRRVLIASSQIRELTSRLDV